MIVKLLPYVPVDSEAGSDDKVSPEESENTHEDVNSENCQSESENESGGRHPAGKTINDSFEDLWNNQLQTIHNNKGNQPESYWFLVIDDPSHKKLQAGSIQAFSA